MAKWKRKNSLQRRWQRQHLIKKYGTDCYICLLAMTVKDMSIDHHQPLSKGGPDTLKNMRLAHKWCNRLKADMTPEQFKAFQDGKIIYETQTNDGQTNPQTEGENQSETVGIEHTI